MSQKHHSVLGVLVWVWVWLRWLLLGWVLAGVWDLLGVLAFGEERWVFTLGGLFWIGFTGALWLWEWRRRR